jgi:outer membrane protein W
MRRLSSVLVFAGVLAAAAPAAAQQSFSFHLGGFVVSPEDSRSRSGGRSDDVLVNNLNTFAFNIKDFNSVTLGGEWLVALGERAEAGLGLGIYTKSVPSVYADLVNEDLSEIEQDFKLRIVPFTASFRFLPLGRSSGVQPYIGAGVGLYRWRYTESGDFVDFDSTIFRETYVGSGGAAGPVVLGGLRFPLGSWDVGGEIRYQNAEGTLPDDQGFSGDKIDLGGFNYLLTFNVRF